MSYLIHRQDITELSLKHLKDLRDYKRDKIEVTFKAYPEDSPVEDNFEFKEDIDFVNRQLNRGFDSAWFVAEIEVKIGPAKGTAYLGACSYKSFEEFISDEDYILDLIEEAFKDAKSELEHLKQEIKEIENYA